MGDTRRIRCPQILTQFHTDSEFRHLLTDKKQIPGRRNTASVWRILNLPHDWAIEGEFSRDNPSGTGGGALPGGIGWYRKTFTVDKADEGKRLYIDFDGVYMNSEVFINGHSLGVRPYGYVSFSYDLTPYIKWGGKNVVAVREQYVTERST